jgi:hypothetical protein
MQVIKQTAPNIHTIRDSTAAIPKELGVNFKADADHFMSGYVGISQLN